MDCDFQHEPSFIPKFIKMIQEKTVDVVSGSRYLKQTKVRNNAPPERLAINKKITALIIKYTQYQLTDAFCGFKAYKTDSLKGLELSEDGYGMPLQFWLQAAASGLRVQEIPITRIYQNLDRSFGDNLDDPKKRLKYYQTIITREAEKWQLLA